MSIIAHSAEDNWTKSLFPRVIDYGLKLMDSCWRDTGVSVTHWSTYVTDVPCFVFIPLSHNYLTAFGFGCLGKIYITRSVIHSWTSYAHKAIQLKGRLIKRFLKKEPQGQVYLRPRKMWIQLFLADLNFLWSCSSNSVFLLFNVERNFIILRCRYRILEEIGVGY